MALSFGTDGVRGVANTELTPLYAFALGRAAMRSLGATTFALGRDTRRSGSMLQAAFAAGLAAQGARVIDLGVLPTPGVAFTCARASVAGAVISASHNPFGDNGIKLFAPGGRKLSDAQERAVEALVSEILAAPDAPGPDGAEVGTIASDPSAVHTYVDWLVSTVPADSLTGLRIVVDAANGAASALAGPVLSRLGADVQVICDRPDGVNINEQCGATHTDALARAVVAAGADLGIALDGDADRCVAVDALGRVVDGDRIIAICAVDRHRRQVLSGDTVVATVMANLGFRHAMAAEGIAIAETAVGDRYVLEALDAGAFVLGGEQSGHVIFRDLATTGDGLLTALQTLDAVRRDGRSFTEVTESVMKRLPQCLVNVRVTGSAAAIVAAMEPEIGQVRDRLGDAGRVLVRPSGTEPLVRVMIEAESQATADEMAAELANTARDKAALAL
ncbi:MAG: phosphoglucosamine mutase [Acidimicrobiia bacterium]